jgi:hypothetical protein
VSVVGKELASPLPALLIETLESRVLENAMDCPQCDQRLTQMGLFWICPTQGLVLLRKPSGPMRTFRNYGHRDATRVVRSLASRLGTGLRIPSRADRENLPNRLA